MRLDRGPGQVWAHKGSRFRCFGKTVRDLVRAGGGRKGRADGTQSLQCEPQCGVPSMNRLEGLLMSSGWACGLPRRGEPRSQGVGLKLWAGPPSGLFPPHPSSLAQGQQPPHTSGTLALAMGVVTTIRARRCAKLLEV